MTLVGPGTWAAARAAVDCALDAAELVAAGEPLAYALCRPPGHHATRAGYGGSCYLNNAAVAAEALRAAGHDRVAVVDVDAHHGNGTAAIFYDRGDVLYGSVHVDPGAGWFPHVWASPTRPASAPARAPPATSRSRRAPATTAGWRPSRELADWVAAAGAPRWWCRSAWTPPRTTRRARCWSPATATARLALLGGRSGLPAVVVQEGGYHLPTLGGLVAAYLEGHASATPGG